MVSEEERELLLIQYLLILLCNQFFLRIDNLPSPKINGKNYKLFNRKYTVEDLKNFTPDWSPSNFRPFVAHSEADYDKKKQTREVEPSLSGKLK